LAQITNQTYLDYLDTFYQKRIEALQSVDDMVAEIVQKLDDKGILDNTYIIYTADNGYHIGHHRMAPGKKCAYEEDVNVPLIIRGPKVAKGMNTTMVTAHVDLAPTVMNMAGLESQISKHKFDGQGLTFPLMTQNDVDKEENGRGEHVNVEMWGSYGQEGHNHPSKLSYQFTDRGGFIFTNLLQ
jgi:N-acetylglucosamine-6-sulfatase